MIDCFMFFNELDLLEIRLNTLASRVERFVLCESTLTHSGKPKSLFFDENKDRFKGFNITHLVSDGGMTPDAGKNRGDPWRRENYQREFLMNGIKDEEPDTMILISDVDEIPDLETYQEGVEGVFRQRVYYYYFNVYACVNNWKGTIAIRKKNITTLNKLRDNRNRTAGNGSRGWHFSTLGTVDNIIYKIESFAHYDLDRPDIKAMIPENRRTLIDPYRRGWNRIPTQCMVEEPSGPKWLLDNKDRYKHLWWSKE